MIPIASAVEYAHLVRNICHRDIKPANVLVGIPDPNLRGSTLQVRLADFNVAKLSDEEISFGMTQMKASVPGTLFFQSPEQETNVLELLVNVTQGTPEIEYFEDFYIQISKNDTFSLFNRSETYPILYADRARKRLVLSRPYRETGETNVRARIQKSVGRPADIYSLGATFYYLISGAYANPKTLYDAFHKFIEYERADENNTIESYLRHEYSVINSLRAPKTENGQPEVAPADRFFSYKHYLDGNGELIDPNVMLIIGKCMIRNKPDSYCQAHDLDTRGVSDLVLRPDQSLLALRLLAGRASDPPRSPHHGAESEHRRRREIASNARGSRSSGRSPAKKLLKARAGTNHRGRVVRPRTVAAALSNSRAAASLHTLSDLGRQARGPHPRRLHAELCTAADRSRLVLVSVAVAAWSLSLDDVEDYSRPAFMVERRARFGPVDRRRLWLERITDRTHRIVGTLMMPTFAGGVIGVVVQAMVLAEVGTGWAFPVRDLGGLVDTTGPVAWLAAGTLLGGLPALVVAGFSLLASHVLRRLGGHDATESFGVGFIGVAGLVSAFALLVVKGLAVPPLFLVAIVSCFTVLVAMIIDASRLAFLKRVYARNGEGFDIVPLEQIVRDPNLAPMVAAAKTGAVLVKVARGEYRTAAMQPIALVAATEAETLRPLKRRRVAAAVLCLGTALLSFLAVAHKI